MLRKREAYREAFHGFDIDRVAAYGDDDVARLLANPGIVRNRLKVRGAIRTAKAVQEIQARDGSLDAFVWNFVGGRHVSTAGRRWERCPPPRPRRRR